MRLELFKNEIEWLNVLCAKVFLVVNVIVKVHFLFFCVFKSLFFYFGQLFLIVEFVVLEPKI
jgi:hypothetical protein